MSLRLANGITATGAAPILATDGFALSGASPGAGPFYWLKTWNFGTIQLRGAGTGALTFQGIIWLYGNLVAAWMPAGIASTIAARGMLNDGTTITGTNELVHTQPIGALSSYARIALQATTLTGTGMALSAYLVPQVER